MTGVSEVSVVYPLQPSVAGSLEPFAGLVAKGRADRLYLGQSLILETHLALAHLAGSGVRVPIGTRVTLTPLRHPVEAAIQARSLAVVLEAIKDRVRDWGPFTRFTKEARTVVVRAQEEARELGHERVGTEHLLLGVLRVDEAMGARVLTRLGVELEPTRAEIVRAVGSGDSLKAGKHPPITPRAKRVLEHSLREALDLQHNYIGTEHILLGLVRERSGLAARLLRDLGADAERVRGETKQALASD